MHGSTIHSGRRLRGIALRQQTRPWITVYQHPHVAPSELIHRAICMRDPFAVKIKENNPGGLISAQDWPADTIYGPCYYGHASNAPTLYDCTSYEVKINHPTCHYSKMSYPEQRKWRAFRDRQISYSVQ